MGVGEEGLSLLCVNRDDKQENVWVLGIPLDWGRGRYSSPALRANSHSIFNINVQDVPKSSLSVPG